MESRWLGIILPPPVSVLGLRADCPHPSGFSGILTIPAFGRHWGRDRGKILAWSSPHHLPLLSETPSFSVGLLAFCCPCGPLCHSGHVLLAPSSTPLSWSAILSYSASGPCPAQLRNQPSSDLVPLGHFLSTPSICPGRVPHGYVNGLFTCFACQTGSFWRAASISHSSLIP